VFDTIIGCLQQAVPGGLAAAGPGMSAIIVYGARDPRTGRNRVSVVNPVCGGSGGRHFCDGVDAIDSRSGYLRSVPTEVIEAEAALRVRAYHLAPDSASAGRWCSGAAVVFEIECTDIEATMTVRGMNRFVFQPWGAEGGAAGQVGEVTLNPGRPGERHIGKISILKLQRGDIVRITTPAGGGFGDPLTRDLALVARDIRSGMLSPERAASCFGIVLSPSGDVDAGASERRRRALTAKADPAPAITPGPVREAVDRIWPDSIRASLAMRVLEQAPTVRPHLLVNVRAALTRANQRVDTAALEDALRDELAALTGSTIARLKREPS
jgi:N-methylhydantoinase B